MRRFPPFFERLLPLSVLIVSVLAVPTMIMSPDGLPRLQRLEVEFTRVEEDNKLLREEIEQLKMKVNQLKEDPKAVEQIARDQLGLIHPTEVVFQFQKK